KTHFLYVSCAVKLILAFSSADGLKFAHLPSQNGRLYSLAPNTWFSASEESTPRLSTVRLLKNRFQKLLPELSGARSVAPLGNLGAMSFLSVLFRLVLLRPD